MAPGNGEGRLKFEPAVLPVPVLANPRLSAGRFAAVLLIVAFVIRLGAVLALRDIHQFHGPGPAGADAVEFNALGLNLASGQGYEIVSGHPTAFRAPGFPVLLALVYKFWPANYLLVYLVLCAVGAVTCVLTWLAARELVNEKVARSAGLLLSLYFPHIYQATLFLSEDLFGLFTIAGIWLVLLFVRTRKLTPLTAAGFLFGLDALTRPVAIVIAGFIALDLAWPLRRKQYLRAAAIPILCFAAAVALAVLPWTFRNFTVFRKPVLIATNGGSTFYGANNDTVLHDPRYKGLWVSTVGLPGRDRIEATPDEVSHDQLEWKLGKEWVAGHLSDMPLLSAYKLVRFVLPNLGSSNRNFVAIQTAAYLPFLFLMGASLFRGGAALWRGQSWRVIHAILAANIFNALIFNGDPRYRDAIAPVLILYAAVGLACLARWFRRSSDASLRATAASPLPISE